MFSASKTAGPSGYNINNSLRFRSSASAYLNRTPASAGNRRAWTYSVWVKRGTLGATQYLAAASSTSGDVFRFRSAEDLEFYLNNGTSGYLQSTQVFRDPSAWYHLVFVVDTANATASNRMKMYVNGSQVTALSTATYPTQNYDTTFNTAVAHNIAGFSPYFDGYMAEVNFIDGQALTPSSFGSTNATTGVWQPAKYTGTYGTNGFYLPFSDIGLTSGSNTGLGKDFSGNSNYWTTNNISVTAGTTYDAMTDSPTLTSATVANYATFAGTNLGTYANATITEAGLKVSVSAGGTPDGGKAYAPFGMSDGSGKWYFEMTCVDPGATNQRLCFGIANVTTNPNAIAITNGYYASASGAHGNYNIGTFTTNDVLQVAYDSGTNKLWFGKNGTWYNSGNPAAGTTPLVTVTSGITYVPFSTYASSGGGPGIGAWNFGQRPFSYTPPTGYVALNTYNLPDSTIKKGNKYMDATAYTGNGVNRSIANGGSFLPDLLWIKKRNSAFNHRLNNTITGTAATLFTNNTDAETTWGGLDAFLSTGFSVSNDSSTNANGDTYVAWQWNAGNNTTSSNTQGSITSTVSVNTTAGFSIVTYTGTGANATVGHGLGVAPKFYIVKRRNASGDYWCCYHVSIGATNGIYLNTTDAAGASTLWQNTSPTSSVFSVSTTTGVNASGGTYVAYCWAEIAGFSKFGSYTGNGSADGPFIYTGFRPKFIIRKQSSGVGDWIIFDNARNPYNVETTRLLANTSNGDQSPGNNIDVLSNGWKERSSDGYSNASGQTYIYMAFAENPFKNALAR